MKRIFLILGLMIPVYAKASSPFVPTFTGTIIYTSTPTNTPTISPTLTFTVTQTKTFTRTATNTPTNSPTLTPTGTKTNTATLTFTNTASLTPTLTFTITPSNSPTQTPTKTPTMTPGGIAVWITKGQKGSLVWVDGRCRSDLGVLCTNTVTLTPTNTPTNTPTLTISATATNSLTPTVTPSMTSNVWINKYALAVGSPTPAVTAITTPRAGFVTHLWGKINNSGTVTGTPWVFQGSAPVMGLPGVPVNLPLMNLFFSDNGTNNLGIARPTENGAIFNYEFFVEYIPIATPEPIY